MTPLRQRMLEDMGIRNFAENTQLSYLQQISAYARHFGRSPEALGPEDVRTYQVHLVEVRKLSAASVGIATSALRFLYKVTLKRDWALEDIPMPKKPFRLPVILSHDEVTRLLESVASLKHRTLLTTTYAAGLRVSEATHLRVTDIDSERMVLRVDQGKGRKDRYVMLSPRLLDTLRAYWRSERPRLWLFPGDRPEQPITKGAVEAACQKARLAALAPPGLSQDERANLCERLAIRLSLRNLETFPAVKRRLEAGTLRMHGWHYDLAQGTLTVLDAATQRFVPVGTPGTQ